MDLQSKLDMAFSYEPIPYGKFKTEDEKIANGKMGGGNSAKISQRKGRRRYV